MPDLAHYRATFPELTEEQIVELRDRIRAEASEFVADSVKGAVMPEPVIESPPVKPRAKRGHKRKDPMVGSGANAHETCRCFACFYCDMPLAPLHEHDHFPVPKHLGGDQMVPACLNCHSLKDRVDFDTWPGKGGVKIMQGILPKLTPVERILFVKIFVSILPTLARTR